MVNDSTIDVHTAKYWCAFADKEMLKLLDDAASTSAEEGKKLKDIANKVVNAKGKKIVAEGLWDWVQIANQTAFPLATGNPFQPNFRGQDPSSGELSLQDQQRNNVIAGATAAALAGFSLVPGGWAALGSAIAGALGTAGTWLAATAATAASLGTAGIMAIVGGLVSVSTYLYPRIARLVKSICREGDVAKCEFEADGQKYMAVFSLSKKRWQLVYTNNRWVRSTVDVSNSDVAAFFSSDFFKKFLAQCKTYIDAVYGNEKRMECLEVLAKMAEKKTQKDIQTVIDAKKTIYDYMLPGTYVSEEESLSCS